LIALCFSLKPHVLESPAPGGVSKVTFDPPAGFFHPLPSPLPRRLSIHRMVHLATHPAGTSRRTGRFGPFSIGSEVLNVVDTLTMTQDWNQGKCNHRWRSESQQRHNQRKSQG
jgi:hypothetical protein